MKLKSMTIENYRSIRYASIPLSDNTVVLGKNNEGKSNILRALKAAMDVLTTEITDIRKNFPGRRSAVFLAMQMHDIYRWNEDFCRTSRTRDQSTVISLEFELSPTDREAFSKTVGSKLNGTLRVKIKFSKEDYKIDFPKQGKGKINLNANREKILKFLYDRIEFQYIPSIRDADLAISAIRNIVRSELREIENDSEYKDAIEKIKNCEHQNLNQSLIE